MMIFFFNNYSSGLSYYYFISTLFSILIMFMIKKFFVDEEKLKLKMEAKAGSASAAGPKKKSFPSGATFEVIKSNFVTQREYPAEKAVLQRRAPTICKKSKTWHPTKLSSKPRLPRQSPRTTEGGRCRFSLIALVLSGHFSSTRGACATSAGWLSR